MPQVDRFPPGLPSWADLSSPETDRSASFYGELFGWDTRQGPGSDEETGGYRMFVKGDHQVAGLMRVMNEGQPPSWSTYISVADADEIAGKVSEAGGQVIVEPMDVMDQGRMAFFVDPTGAAFGVWQPRAHTGADIVSEPGATAWHQVNTREPEKALDFYSSVFGWESEKVDTGGADYWELKLDGASVGGLLRMGDDFPDEVPAHWIVYFAVEDVDGVVEKASKGGATVRAAPFDTEVGRIVVMTDPHGAAFAVIDQSTAGDGQEDDERDEEAGAGEEGAGDAGR